MSNVRSQWKKSFREYRVARRRIISEMSFNEPNKQRDVIRQLNLNFPKESRCLWGFGIYQKQRRFAWVVKRAIADGKTAQKAIVLADKFRTGKKG